MNKENQLKSSQSEQEWEITQRNWDNVNARHEKLNRSNKKHSRNH
jgi:hypothetical protein